MFPIREGLAILERSTNLCVREKRSRHCGVRFLDRVNLEPNEAAGRCSGMLRPISAEGSCGRGPHVVSTHTGQGMAAAYECGTLRPKRQKVREGP